jgi:chromosomal replication initiation ATPase DnaA
MNLEQKMKAARRAYNEWMRAADAVANELERRTSFYQCELPSVRTIQHVVAGHYMLAVSAMTSPIRSERFAKARQVAMYLCRELTKHSQQEIGKCFGGRDHGTVAHAISRVTAEMQTDPLFAGDVSGVRHAAELAIKTHRHQIAA